MNKFLKNILVLVAVSQMVLFAPSKARASLISDIMKGIELAGYWPSELPAPEAMLNLISLAQKCSESDILTCVNSALDDQTIDEGLGDSKEKIQFAVDVYVDISTGDYLGLILHLGKPAGCFAAAMIVGVPVCTWAEALASIAGAIADVGQEVYNFLQENGASAVWESDDYWDIYYAPNIDLGVQIHLHSTPEKLPTAFGELSGPLYHTCYELLVKHHPPKDSTIACENLQAQFVADIHTKLDSFIVTGRQNTATEYDKMKPQWLAIWNKRCDLSSSATANIDALIESCQKNVAKEIEKGRTLAIDMTAGFLIPATVMYDSKSAAEAGYKYYKTQVALQNAVKLNEQIELDFQNNSNSGTAVLKKVKYEIETFMADTKAWQSQCKAGNFENDCEYEIKKAWYSCQQKLTAIPTVDGDLQNTDYPKVQAAKEKCEASYSAVIGAFTQFWDRRGKMFAMSELCPKEPLASGVLFQAASEQCKKDVKQVAEKCGGGTPVFTEEYYKSGIISQTPKAPANCDSDVNYMQDKWGQDDVLYAQVESAYQSARAVCVSDDLGESCINAVMEIVKDCRTGVSQQANALGVISNLPGNQGKISSAISKMKTSTAKCIAEIPKVPDQFAKTQKIDEITISQYGKDCPSNKSGNGKQNYFGMCQAALLEAVHECQTAAQVKPLNGSARSHKGQSSGKAGTPEMLIVEKCKPQLQAVIEDYKKKTAKKEIIIPEKENKRVEFAPDTNSPAAPKRKNLLTAPPAMLGIQTKGIENVGNSDLKIPAATAPVQRTGPIKMPVGGVRAVTMPAATTPAKQLEEKGCVLSTSSRVSNTFICKSDEGLKLCEELKAAHKAGGCVKGN